MCWFVLRFPSAERGHTAGPFSACQSRWSKVKDPPPVHHSAGHAAAGAQSMQQWC